VVELFEKRDGPGAGSVGCEMEDLRRCQFVETRPESGKEGLPKKMTKLLDLPLQRPADVL
jgi:hypothetical protein